MIRPLASGLVLVAMLAPTSSGERFAASQSRAARELVADLAAGDAAARARAACALRDLGDGAADAIPPLVDLLADATPIESSICGRSWWRGSPNDLTSPGEQAAAALVAIGSRAFDPVLRALRG